MSYHKTLVDLIFVSKVNIPKVPGGGLGWLVVYGWWVSGVLRPIFVLTLAQAEKLCLIKLD